MATAERSHGSSRALEELKGIFLKCCMEGLYESIQFAVLPAYTDVLKKFMIDDTLYGNYLANRILSDFLFLWTNTFIITKEVERRYPILKNTQKNFFVLLSTKIVVSAHGKDNLNFGPDLTAKSKEAVIVISEAFSIGFYLPLIAPVEAYLRVKLLIEFLEKFAEATQLGIKSKLAHVGFFVSNFYECCFLVLQGFPKHLLIDVAYQPTSSGEIQFEESEKNQNAFEFAVIECLDKVLSQVLTDSSNLHSDEYEWLFSLIGMLLIKSNYKPNLRIECEKLISKVRDAVKKELEERSNSYLLPYLQLLGAWRSVDSSPNSLGDGVEALLKNYYAEQRSQRGYVDFRSARTETGWMGYPEYNIGGGIFIPPLRNININRDEYFKVRDILLNMEVLKRYAITVGAIESDDDETI